MPGMAGNIEMAARSANEDCKQLLPTSMRGGAQDARVWDGKPTRC